jgi:uncharacterized protein YuzE
MKTPYLEMTYRRGRPLAAYLYLGGSASMKSARTERVGAGLLVDYAESGKPIGIEITQPGQAVVDDLNRVLQGLGLPELTEGDAAPLRAA